MEDAHSNEAPVGMLEVHDGRPVVRSVLLELAAGAGRRLGKVKARVHGQIEAVYCVRSCIMQT